MLTARLKHFDLKPGDWALDLGCGEGRHVHGFHMLGGVHVIGLDLDIPSLVKARDGLAFMPERAPEEEASTGFLQGDATRLPFGDDTFDALICSEVLEHIPDYKAVLAEIRRVLKQDGRLCITVPHAWPEKICWWLAPAPDGYPHQPGGHIRIFEAAGLRRDVEAVGFAQSRKHHAHGIHSPYWWLKCLFWERRDDHPLIKLYHRFLVWDIMQRPWLSRAIDTVTSPFMGKSLVLYFRGDKTS